EPDGVSRNGLLALAFRCHPQDFLDRGLAGRYFLGTTESKRLHTLLVGIPPQLFQLTTIVDLSGQVVGKRHNFIDTGASHIAGVPAFQTTHRVVELAWQWRFPR